MQDWSARPPRPTILAFGYTAAQNGVLVLQGWLYDLSKDTPANAQLIGKRYLATVDEAGARKIAHEFAADIITSVRRSILIRYAISTSPATVPAIKKSG